MIQTLLADRPHPAFGISIGVGSLNGRGNDADVLRSENGIVSGGELLVVVADQETRLDFSALEFPDVLPGLLSDPRAIRLSGDPSQVNPSRSQFDVEQHV